MVIKVIPSVVVTVARWLIKIGPPLITEAYRTLHIIPAFALPEIQRRSMHPWRKFQIGRSEKL